MSHFVLLHGSFHGPWCWDKIAAQLSAEGHDVTVPDLADADSSNGAYPDLHDYAALVARAVAEAGDRVILVGHSMGGLVITQAAERVSGNIAALVYVSGLLLRNGETLQSFLEAHGDLGIDDLVLKNMQVSENGALASFPATAAREVFYHRCPEADAAWAASQLRAQPTAVYAAPLAVSAGKFGSVPRYYVKCEDDQAVSTAYQTQMLANTPCNKIHSLDADHSPFLSNIDGLMECLRGVAANVS